MGLFVILKNIGIILENAFFFTKNILLLSFQVLKTYLKALVRRLNTPR